MDYTSYKIKSYRNIGKTYKHRNKIIHLVLFKNVFNENNDFFVVKFKFEMIYNTVVHMTSQSQKWPI